MVATCLRVRTFPYQPLAVQPANLIHYHVCRITTYSDLPFYVIINPASGPGSSGSQPDASYQLCIPGIQGANVKILGYVATGYGSGTNVATDIATYAGWDSSYRPDGIFFDETSTSSGDYNSYATWAADATASFASGSGYVSSIWC